MNLLFVMDPFSTVHPFKDSTVTMMLEADRRGWSCFYCLLHELAVVENRPHARARRVRVWRPDKAEDPFYEEGPTEALWLDELDAVFMRKDPPFDRAFIFATFILDLAVGHALVVNDPVGLRLANEKMYAFWFPELIPPSTVSCRPADLRAFMAAHGGEMILKPWDMAGGGGIFHVHQGDRNLSSLLEMTTRFGTEYVIAQQYLPEVRRGDKRILLVDGEPLGGFLRVPAEDEHRSNMHVGGRVVAAELTARDREICAQVGPALKRDGLLFVGIDVIGGHLTEVNVTSPTGIQEVRALGGPAIDRALMDAVEARLAAGQRKLRS